MSDPMQTVAGRFSHFLKLHGYGFQSAVMAACEGVPVREGPMTTGAWHVVATEIPIRIGEQDGHVDGLLEMHDTFGGNRRFVAVECERVDRSVKDWRFVRSSSPTLKIVCDRFELERGHKGTGATAMAADRARVYDLGFEIRSAASQECPHSKRLEDARDQTVRSASGLVGTLESLPKWVHVPESGVKFHVIPLLVTTATLHVTETVLSESDLRSGNPPPDLSLSPVPWLWWTFNVSGSLRPHVSRNWQIRDHEVVPIRYRLANESMRSMMVTTVDGLGEALADIGRLSFYPLTL